ncbi:hypothetical protein GILI108418_08975 [Gillisia limnaea]|uniref:Uncharacterized protein n=1 Tax=Gillisia limnaea (strain DSM 15749 / LMG 21470 / R-8282) TaxID=865937 RepID=H2BUK6_GILLR|nr:hypothetical protein Gilli_3278 [Gillisia limnaea DSM 15749]
MTERRGFVKYRDFNQKLMQLYAHRTPGQKNPDLYPEIIKNFKKAVPIQNESGRIGKSAGSSTIFEWLTYSKVFLTWLLTLQDFRQYLFYY